MQKYIAGYKLPHSDNPSLIRITLPPIETEPGPDETIKDRIRTAISERLHIPESDVELLTFEESPQ